MSILGWCGCIYVFYRTYEQWRLNDKKLKMIHRLPFYTACSDFLIDTNFFVNVIHTAIYAEVWGQPMCNIICILHWLFLLINLSLYGVIAVTTYLRICHEKYFYRGKYDYKIWVIIITAAIIFQLININNHGPRVTEDQGKEYLLHYYSKNEEIKIMNRLRISEIEKKAAWKIISYILLFILQWLPVQINIATRWTTIRETWTYILGALVTFGGIGNAIIYICNEGWYSRKYEIEAETTNLQVTNNFNINIEDGK
uniref:G-protein coupled receptors family 1 profile domain-containing protein n=1 Tax=Rhizophagus irregularis (strain DAOM 181602 / DAOM 197198 / MUCL 43194) TaxID=747089 RepID=U9TEL5_RHIID